MAPILGAHQLSKPDITFDLWLLIDFRLPYINPPMTLNITSLKASGFQGPHTQSIGPLDLDQLIKWNDAADNTALLTYLTGLCFKVILLSEFKPSNLESRTLLNGWKIKLAGKGLIIFIWPSNGFIFLLSTIPLANT